MDASLEDLGLLDIMAFVFFVNTLWPFVTHESTERGTFLVGGNINTTLNTKLLVQITLCVWAE